jgi:hypothetical protein
MDQREPAQERFPGDPPGRPADRFAPEKAGGVRSQDAMAGDECIGALREGGEQGPVLVRGRIHARRGRTARARSTASAPRVTRPSGRGDRLGEAPGSSLE